jgi:hypothetical protein
MSLAKCRLIARPDAYAKRGILAAAVVFAAADTGTAQSPRQTDADHYTRYELLAPGTAKFRIVYEVTATTAGATKYFNPIRRGSVATDEAVFDRMSGKPLVWSVVPGRVAREGGVRGADTTGEYISVTLPRAVPTNGEVRLLIDKTYEDARSYLSGGDTVLFTRSLGIKKNTVVLPLGYEVIAVNYPSQILTEADGRIALSFMNIGPDQVPYVVRARRIEAGLKVARGGPPTRENSAPVAASTSPPARTSTNSPQTNRPDVLRDSRLGERARQDREIVYFLQQPETHAFDLYHDYTESRPGIGRYLNIVRAGSKVSNPSAYILDTGERLDTRTLRGNAITSASIDIGQPVEPETEVVVISFTPPKQGESVRLRISETYADPARYRLEGDLLVWDRAFGRPANAMVLPAGWSLTNCSVPATVTLTDDGRTRLDFLNQRNDEISVLLTARRRTP